MQLSNFPSIRLRNSNAEVENNENGFNYDLSEFVNFEYDDKGLDSSFPYENEQSAAEMLEINPDNTIFAFDLHEVVLQPDFFRMLCSIFLTFAGLKFLFVVLIHPLIWFSIFWRIYTSGKPAVTEEIWFWLVNKHPSLRGSTSFFIFVVNLFRPDQNTVYVIRQLKNRKFQVFLFSNIGCRFWEQLYDNYRSLFDLFDGISVTSEEDGYIAKPNPKAFALFMQNFNPKCKRVIFVDDQKRNLEAAQNFSPLFYGYRFSTGNTLLNDFRKLKLVL